jgi:PilZ domain-containing protein
MANQHPTELAELTISVLPDLPVTVVSPRQEDPARLEPVVLELLEGELLQARWEHAVPDIGEERELRLNGDLAVYLFSATVAAYGPDAGSRMLRVTGLRRQRQRRSSPRGEVRDLVLISYDGEVDAELVDVSAGGVAFIIDRPLPVDATIRAVLNLHGAVVPTEAQVKQVTSLAEGYRVGCVFTAISESHRARLGRHATQHPIDRRAGAPPSSLRERLFLPD